MSRFISVGPVSVDFFSCQLGASLEDASTFEKEVGGSAANVAIGLSRLGLETALISTVGEESMGNYLLRTLDDEGVDRSYIHVDPNIQTAISLRGVIPPDFFPTLEYRSKSAAANRDIEGIGEFAALYLSGSMCSTESSFQMVEKFLNEADKQKAKVVVDIDFHPALWEDVHTICKRLISVFRKASVIIGTEKELMIATGQTNPGSALVSLRAKSEGVIVQKRGKDGCIAYPKSLDKPVIVEPFQVNAQHTIGSGDAFLCGYIQALLEGKKIEECCRIGSACGALVASRKGLSRAIPFKEELAYYIKNPDDFEQADHLHRVLKRQKDSRRLCLLAIDHRKFFENLSFESFTSDVEIGRFKMLVYKGLQKAAPSFQDFRFGLVVDARYGHQVMRQAISDGDFVVAQCIEEPGAPSLSFLNDEEASKILQQWPRQVAVNVHVQVSDDEKRQNAQAKRLHDLSRAADTTGHELIIKLSYLEQADNLEPIVKFISLCYQSKVYPTWWSLPSISDPASWNELENLIDKYDPHCLGILLINHCLEESELVEAVVSITSKQPVVKGIHMGRTLWGHCAERWLNGELSDEAVVEEVAAKLCSIIEKSLMPKVAG